MEAAVFAARGNRAMTATLAFGALSTPTAARRRRPAWYHLRWQFIAAMAVCYMFCLGVLMLFEESFIYFPLRYPEGEWQPADVAFEDAWFQSADGVKLHGWYAGQEHPRAVVLFSHGNGGNVTHRAEALRALHEVVGASVLVYDYRGYGRSGGKPDEAGLYADARAARAWLARRTGTAERDIVLLGESIGGAVAVELAQEGACGLVLESTFTSVPDMAAYHYPWLPVRTLLRNRFDSLSKIGSYHGPLLMSHGDADTIVPYQFGRRLFEAANEPKQLVTLPGHDHNDPQPREYYEALIRFFDRLPPAGSQTE